MLLASKLCECVYAMCITILKPAFCCTITFCPSASILGVCVCRRYDYQPAELGCMLEILACIKGVAALLQQADTWLSGYICQAVFLNMQSLVQLAITHMDPSNKVRVTSSHAAAAAAAAAAAPAPAGSPFIFSYSTLFCTSCAPRQLLSLMSQGCDVFQASRLKSCNKRHKQTSVLQGYPAVQLLHTALGSPSLPASAPPPSTKTKTFQKAKSLLSFKHQSSSAAPAFGNSRNSMLPSAYPTQAQGEASSPSCRVPCTIP